jgi:radical SAM protein with 4Fe4S-binding SPASM domain
VTDHWEKNIALRIRIRIFFRDYYLKYISNPYQLFRRKNGLMDKDLFRHIKIQTNYKCTRRCSFCHYGQENPPKNVDIEAKLFYSIIDQLESLSYSGSIGFFEINEPLYDKRMPEFIQYARQHLPKAWLIITTNGDLLKEGMLESLLNDGLNFIYLNSYDENACIRNKKLMGDLSESLRAKVNNIDRTYQTSWTSRAGNLKEFAKEPLSKPCDMVYNICYIKPTGKIYSCICDFYDVNEMGDLNKQSLVDAWFSDEFMNLRKEMNKGNRSCNDLCSQCDYSGFGSLPKIPVGWKIKRCFSIDTDVR